ncbi:MAG TPA: flagellar basal body L-ring protein FlgH [Planctomycetota bacterium]|nr:flagellar basal body L-ring protein FlgH [Planctomycetota bacterium]
MKTIAYMALIVLGAATSASAQSLLEGNGSPNDPPKKPGLKKHDHVQIRFVDREKPAGPARWDKDLKDWVRVDGKEAQTPSALTAEVADLRPNGTIVLQAVKRRIVNNEEEVVRLTCEVAASNVVDGKTTSDHVANLTLSYDGSGVEGAKPGLLGWLFGRIWPF